MLKNEMWTKEQNLWTNIMRVSTELGGVALRLQSDFERWERVEPTPNETMLTASDTSKHLLRLFMDLKEISDEVKSLVDEQDGE